MMNVFQLSFGERLASWVQLRESLNGQTPENICTAVDAWWQSAPYVNHYLHYQDTQNWPDPWTLLAENHYCAVAKALGMCYTLWMTDIESFELVIATDIMAEQFPLVLVNHAKYILNYHPNTVLSNNLHDFTIQHTVQIQHLKQKLK